MKRKNDFKARALIGEEPKGRGRVIAVLGPLGAVGGPTTGRTTVAVNLAVALAQMGQRVVLVDLDFRFADAALCMGISSRYPHLPDVPKRPLSYESLRRCLVRHGTGVHVLNADVGNLAEAVNFLAQEHGSIVLDTYTDAPVWQEAFRLADTRLLVTNSDPTTVKDTRIFLDHLGERGCPVQTIDLVANALSEAEDAVLGDVARVLGREVTCSIPYERRLTMADFGTPLVVAHPDSEAAHALRRLAEMLAGPR